MRRLMVWLPEGNAEAARAAVREHGAVSSVAVPASDGGQRLDLLVVEVPNAAVGDVVGALQDLGDVSISFGPRGVLSLRPPHEEVPEVVADVAPRSPLEILLSGLQSIGSWRGFLAYAGIAGAVVWIGLTTNTSYLLVAAMLLAPFAGPAMNTAIATARGDRVLLRRSVLRYAASLATTIAVTAVLSVLFQLDHATTLMVSTGNLSAAAVLLPLAAGAAGAVNLCQSERSSLVSGAATGMLIAASLAPPAGVVGMAAVLGDWGLAGTGGFLLVLQLAGVNLAGSAVFRLYGVHPEGPRYPRGRKAIGIVSAAVSAVVLAALLATQLQLSPELTRATVAQRAESAVTDEVESDPRLGLVEVSARFPRATGSSERLLVTVVVVGPSPDEAPALAGRIQEVLAAQQPAARSVVDVTVLRG
jgi:uncharacterized membrane protein